MIGRSKNSRENYPRKWVWTHEKETRVKFNPGLSANRLSYNWALHELRSASTTTGLSPEEAPVKYSGKNSNNRQVASAQGTMGREKTREALLPLPFVLSFSLTPASPPYGTKRTLRRRERRATESASWSVIHLSQFLYVSLGDYSWNLDPFTNG